MADPKDSASFFRKVARFVANPASDWHDLNSRRDGDSRDDGFDKSELRAMAERKRRNDFVRRREFDMLRRLRREGLSPGQLASLGTSSRVDDSDIRVEGAAVLPSGGVKAKIDAIERQMVGDSRLTTPLPAASTRSASLSAPEVDAPVSRNVPGAPRFDVGDFPATALETEASSPVSPTTLNAPWDAAPARLATSPTSGVPAGGSPTAPLTNFRLHPEPASLSRMDRIGAEPSEVEVNEVAYDPELDEAVIAFANADFEQCEHSLTSLTGPQGPRAEHAETWMVLFDLFRATGQQQRFEGLAMEYAQRFGWSAPQWYSLPQLVAEAVAVNTPRRTGSGEVGDIGWVAPEELDQEAVTRLRSQTLQMPLPWVFDWSAMNTVAAEAATQLSALCRQWASQRLDMRWLGVDRLFAALYEAAPPGVRDADPAFWLARLDILRLLNRPDQFDETAIDYCVTYEVSPPSWEPAFCKVHVGDLDGQPPSGKVPTLSMSMSLVSEVSTSFLESGLAEDPVVELASVELSGQLIGDIEPTLRRLSAQVGNAGVVSVSCTRLIRVDFLAAGDLLNWVLLQRSHDRTVQFQDAHRLVALFFTAMGISEHAVIQGRKV